MSLESKLADYDRRAEPAVDWLLAFLAEYREALIHLGRGRQVRGHFEYQDKRLYEFGPERLAAEIAEELADAIVYAARRLDLPPAD